MPLYVAFEGVDWSGKSTQASRLADRIGAVLTHEPGGTGLGLELRRLLLGVGESPVTPRAETLLMAADRAQHLHEVVLPALAEGRHVVSDRSAYSSLAYQGGGRGLGLDAVRETNDWAVGGRWPDLAVFLDTGLSALADRRSRNLDRLEAEHASFHEATREAYLELVQAEPERWILIDGSGEIDDIARRVWEAIEPRLTSDG